MIRKIIYLLSFIVMCFVALSIPVKDKQEIKSVELQAITKGHKVIEGELKMAAIKQAPKPFKDSAYTDAEEEILKKATLILPNPVPPKFPKKVTDKNPKIVIVIDDLGLSHRTRDVIDLPYKLTLAFLPDPKKSPQYAKEASKKGHEVIIHMPMEAMSFNKEEASILKVSMSQDQIEQRLDKAFKKIPHAVGLNNHTGSKYTSDEQAISRVLSYLKQRDLLFLDSKTISSSKAGKVAQDNNYPILERSVFIDHDVDSVKIKNALEKTERWATKHGVAIAIGHPYEETISALKEWLPQIEDKGYQLVTLKSLIQ